MRRTGAVRVRIVMVAAVAICSLLTGRAQHSTSRGWLDRFPLRSESPHLERATRAGAFFDVVGRRAALFGYENRTFEAWAYPLKLVDDFALSFALEGYPLDIDGRDIMASIEVRPEATTITYAHAAFTVRQVMFVPLDEPGAIVMLEIDSVLPMRITVSFRPRLRLMWPAPSTTANIGWDADRSIYSITEDSGKYAGVIGCPGARDISLMPYQEEPRDFPDRFVIDATPEELATHRIPIVIAGSIDGRESARAAYDRLLASTRSLYEQTSAHYERLDAETVSINTPDDRLNTAFRWAKVGVDKGIATNPFLGTGLLAGFRTSGDSERPGYAWFFGRDALWTSLASTSEGAFDTTRTALEFLRKFQRADGKIPHEISQSASIVKWFDDYPYAWASADATPLYVIAHADYFRATGDRAFLQRAWPSIVSAYRFSAATDTDGNGLIENTNVGHGWVEGGALYPPHEEIYLQGLWIEASHAVAALARAMNDQALATAAAAAADRTRAAMESTYWNGDRGFYQFATTLARDRVAEPGPNRSKRQARLDQLRDARAIDEDTVLPAVPLWFGAMQDDRAQQELDHLGSGAIATDWGARIISSKSALYDPLSYHYGSVWPLFTGWSSVAAYRYGRPHVGYQALMATALLTYSGALGYITELLSGDFATPFGRSSHHQVWSEAMVVAPVVRGLLGIEIADAGGTISFAPALPASWDTVDVRGVAAGNERYDVSYKRQPGKVTIRIAPRQMAQPASNAAGPHQFVIAPSFPLDARVRAVTINGSALQPEIARTGDLQRLRVVATGSSAELVCTYDEGTDIVEQIDRAEWGASNQGLRVLRSRAERNALHLRLEGLGGRTYTVSVRTPRRLGAAEGVEIAGSGADRRLAIRFDGPATEYVRRDITIPLLPR